jgi:hypothetical protein
MKEKKTTTKQSMEFLSDMKGVLAVLKKAGINIENLRIIDFPERYCADDNRQGIILNVQEAENKPATRIIIDAKPGEPTTEQVFDVVYGRGQRCSKRIIIFTMDKNKSDFDNPTAFDISVSAVISQMNRYSLDIHLFRASSKDVLLKFEIEDFDEDQKVPLSPEDLPSALRYRFEEFWSIIFHRYFSIESYEPLKVFSDGIRQTSEMGFLIYIDTKYSFDEMQIYWDNDGIKMIMKQENRGNTLFDLWRKKEKELLQKFNNVALNCTAGMDNEIVFKYAQRPVTWLLNASQKEKIDFAKMFSDYAFEIREYLEGVLDSILVVS